MPWNQLYWVNLTPFLLSYSLGTNPRRKWKKPGGIRTSTWTAWVTVHTILTNNLWFPIVSMWSLCCYSKHIIFIIRLFILKYTSLLKLYFLWSLATHDLGIIPGLGPTFLSCTAATSMTTNRCLIVDTAIRNQVLTKTIDISG